MFHKLFFSLTVSICFSSVLLAQPLLFQQGFVQAHTSVFGDSDINPKSTHIKSQLHIDLPVESLSGEIVLELLSLKSDNDKRDAHMYEALKVSAHPEALFRIQSVRKESDAYLLEGMLLLNGVQKPLKTRAIVSDENNQLALKGAFQIKMSDFGIVPPTLLFLSVRDEVDVNYDLVFERRGD